MYIVHKLALCICKEISFQLKKLLLEKDFDIEVCFQSLDTQGVLWKEWEKENLTNKLKNLDLVDAHKELEYCQKHGIQILFIGDVGYPARLRQIDYPPLLLFWRGSGNLNYSRCVSIVGTRNSTAYGQKVCTELIDGLAGSGVGVISGLAHGIDSHAHAEALGKGLPTWGVLAHGLHTMYPAVNRFLAQKMEENGGVLSEYRTGTPVLKWQFPARNRIIAGLSDVTIVIEASQKGGALITANYANQYNREVCAFSGNAYQSFSKGCNYLIKTQQAHLIESSTDLLQLMNWNDLLLSNTFDLYKGSKNDKILKFSDPREEDLFQVLKQKMDWKINDVQDITKLDFSTLYARLWSLEEMGVIRISAGNRIKMVHFF